MSSKQQYNDYVDGSPRITSHSLNFLYFCSSKMGICSWDLIKYLPSEEVELSNESSHKCFLRDAKQLPSLSSFFLSAKLLKFSLRLITKHFHWLDFSIICCLCGVFRPCSCVGFASLNRIQQETPTHKFVNSEQGMKGKWNKDFLLRMTSYGRKERTLKFEQIAGHSTVRIFEKNCLKLV